MSASPLPRFAAFAVVGILAAAAIPRLATVPWQAHVALGLALALAWMPRRPAWALAAVALCIGAARFSASESARQRLDALVRAAAADREPRLVEGTVRAIARREPDRVIGIIAEAETGARLRFTVVAAGEEMPELLPGDRVKVVGRLKPAVRYRLPGAAAPTRRLDGSLSTVASKVRVVSTGPPSHPRRWAARAQARTVRWVAARDGPTDGKAVVRAALTGDRGGMPAEVSQALRDAGAAHVLAVSGLHLAAIAGLSFLGARKAAAAVPWLALRCRPARVAVAVAAPVAIFYTLITGAQTSTVRALVMALAALGGAALDRRPRAVEGLCLAALAIAIASPHALFEPGFQLSFAAAAALVWGGAGGGHGRGVRRVMTSLRSLLRASVLTAVATAPFTALAFGQVAVAGVVTNLVAVPLTSVAVLPLGLVGAALAAVWPAGGAAVAELAMWVAAGVVRSSAAVAEILPPWAAPPPNAAELAALCALAAVVCAISRRRLSRWRAAIALAVSIACAACATAVTTSLARGGGDALRLTFLEVGQGDASIVELPTGEVWLIDAGGEAAFAPGLDRAERRRLVAAPGEQAVVAELRRRRVRALDRVIVSHAHADHYGGLVAVAEAMPIRELWIARPHAERPPPAAFRALVAELALGGTRIVYPRLDAAHRHGEVVARVLAPRFLDDRATDDPVHGANENSLVVAIDFAGRRVLFAGDVEHEAEAALTRERGAALAADIVQVPHHGSRTSSTPAFVSAASPGWAIISCGPGNRYGLPDEEVVERWRRAGARVLTTAEVGSVTAHISSRGDIRVVVADPRPLAGAP